MALVLSMSWALAGLVMAPLAGMCLRATAHRITERGHGRAQNNARTTKGKHKTLYMTYQATAGVNMSAILLYRAAATKTVMSIQGSASHGHAGNTSQRCLIRRGSAALSGRAKDACVGHLQHLAPTSERQ